MVVGGVCLACAAGADSVPWATGSWTACAAGLMSCPCVVWSWGCSSRCMLFSLTHNPNLLR